MASDLINSTNNMSGISQNKECPLKTAIKQKAVGMISAPRMAPVMMAFSILF